MFWISDKVFSITLSNGFEIALTNVLFEDDSVSEVVKFTLSNRDDNDEPRFICDGLISNFGFMKLLDVLRNLPKGFGAEEMKNVVQRSILALDSVARKYVDPSPFAPKQEDKK